MGCLVRVPLGGITWHYLQYVSGFAALGHEVLYLEDSDDYQESCYDPKNAYLGPDPDYGLAYVEATFKQAGLEQTWAYHDMHGTGWRGPRADSAEEFCRSADVVLNISGCCPMRPWLEEIPVRAYVDTDPAFEQIRQLTDSQRRQLADSHNRFLTFGENIATGSCKCPDADREWLGTRQPIDLRYWPSLPGRPTGAFTTVLKWDSYATQEYNGQLYGMKSHSMQQMMDLPTRTDHQLELAVGGETTPYDELKERGWRLSAALEVSQDAWSYRKYIQDSKAEFAVTKHGYVAGRTGWFSERSAAYLATGRPVVTADTRTPIPSGLGLLTFSSPDDAVAAVESVHARYDDHCRYARDLAEEYFAARKVLPKLLESAMDSRPSAEMPSFR